jgi:hypothetical protein
VTAAAGPAAARFVNSVMPSIIPGGGGGSSSGTPKDSQTDAAPQKGSGGVLFEGVDGVPATNKAVKEYKRRPHPIDEATKLAAATNSVKRPRHNRSTAATRAGKTVHFNF